LLGNEAGKNNTIGDYNVFIGHQSGYNDTASYNTFVGYKSGYSNKTGKWNVLMGFEAGYYNDADYNSFIGYQAGKNYTTGKFNTFIGYQSGLASISNGSGNSNVALGYQSGSNLTSGYNNVFIGTQAGDSTTTGYQNTFIGYWAGKDHTTGYQNIAIGFYAGKGLTTNNRNTVVGNNAGEYLSSGGTNAFFGTYAGRLTTTGNGNTFIGYDCGYQCDVGSNNTCLGWMAGRGISTYFMGDANVYIGYQAGYYSSSDSSVFIGNRAGYSETGPQKLYIANSHTSTPLIWGDFSLGYATIHGKLGINTKTPTHSVDVEGQMRINNGGNYDVWIQGGGSTAMGDDRNLAILGLSETFGDKLIINFDTEYANGVEIGGNVGMLGNLGVGITTPDKKLHVEGDARVTGSIYYGTSGTTTTYTKPDFVFENEYNNYLNPLQVCNFIKTNGHLPWLTKASDEKDGINLTRMQFETVETVENLQLQIIHQQSEIDALKAELAAIKELLKK
ncbi:MAG: hypothetical protein M0P66_16440, partial [Salinivirgaceae bacterium]|nr:hypothetical protein [Salinivirgaceae bacterium]